MKCLICMLVQLNIRCLICINRQHPKHCIEFDNDAQAHRERGVAGASAPGPGGPKGARRAPKKFKACVKRGESKAEMGRLKTVHQTQHASSLELNFF